jgi:para-nitrobenzyl esterase
VVQVHTDGGIVAGIEDRGAFRFRGIPFAAPPFGADRFGRPRSAASWDGVRDTSLFGAGVPQAGFPGDPFDAYFNPLRQGEDCLTVDVWTPDPGGAGLPVMVWIHGGGFMTGSGSAPAHDGRTFALDGIVHVGLNYRLGVDGFTHFEGSGSEGTAENRGLRDQVAALEWVQRNISAFGGDPARVTIFGQSGGGVAVYDLLAMPSARGLFAQAIPMSGSPVGSVDAETAMRVTRRLADRLGVPATAEAFAELPLERIIAETLPMAFEFMDTSAFGSESMMISPYRAVHGTETLPESPLAAAAASEVPVMLGTLRNEATGFLATLGELENLPEEVGARMLQLVGADDEVLGAYRTGPRALTETRELVEAAWTDWAFRMPSLDYASARRLSTHVYEFRWESPFFPPRMGANHALEVPFMRDDLAAMRAIGPAGQALLGSDAPQGLAERMHRAFADFAISGDPGWPADTPSERITKVFDAVDTVEHDPAAPERQAWEGKR